MSIQSTLQTLDKLVIQMSGAPGSGKSTMAGILRRSISQAVVIDHDVLRSTLLDSNIPFDQAAKHAYQLQWKLAQDFVKQGVSVIIDSTCNSQEVLDRGFELAKQHDYSFWYVECKVEDVDLLDQRLRTRVPMTSQRTGVDCPPPAALANGACTRENSRALFEKWIKSPCRPKVNVVIVDSTGDLEERRDQILERISG